MNISEVPTRNAEDAWIEKYRKAVEAASIEPPHRPRLNEILIRLRRSLASHIGRALDRWWQPKNGSSPIAEIAPPSPVLHPANPINKKTTALPGDAEHARMAG